MMDLQAAMARAAPRPMSIDKEEWLAKRGEVPRAVRRKSYQHGKERTSAAAASDDKEGVAGDESTDAPPAVLASIPATVPELPSAFLPREGSLEQLKKSLLGKRGNDTTTIAAKKNTNKVGAHGMG